MRAFWRNRGENWLAVADTFRTLAVCRLPGVRVVFFTLAYFWADGMNGKCRKCRACLTRQARRNNIVITMRTVHVSIRQIGNSQGVVIPKPVLAQLALDSKAGAEMTIEDGALVLRRPASPARAGWAEAARRIAEAGDDELVMGEFGNAEDSELVW